MTIDLANPPTDPALLHRMLRDLVGVLQERDTQLRERDGRIKELEHQLAVLRRYRFGRRSERLDPNQGLLFADAADAPEPPPAPRAKPKRRNGHGRRPLPDHLPRGLFASGPGRSIRETIPMEAELPSLARSG